MTDYGYYLDFMNLYLEGGFTETHPLGPALRDADRFATEHRQFFYVADIIRLKYYYVHPNSRQILGVNPEEVDPAVMLSLTHPDDLKRHQYTRTHLIKMGNDIYRAQAGTGIISTNVKAKKIGDGYFDLLYQGMVRFRKKPYPSVFLLMVLTDISQIPLPKKGFHYYAGTETDMFRLPDEKLLKTGIPFSDTEYKILQLIESGLSSDEIAQKIFRSRYTIDTHRRNIIRKAGKSDTNEVILGLKENGLL
jgi:DNA-binding CsgD family transcriptional regulator